MTSRSRSVERAVGEGQGADVGPGGLELYVTELDLRQPYDGSGDVDARHVGTLALDPLQDSRVPRLVPQVGLEHALARQVPEVLRDEPALVLEVQRG